MWWIPLATAGVSAISNLFSAQAKAREEQRRIAKAQELIGRSLIDNKQLDEMLRDNTRLFNQRLVNTLNATALEARGTSNAGVAGAQAAGQIEGARAASEIGIKQNVLKQNAEIRTAQAQLGLGGSISDPLGDFIQGAVAGGIAGSQMARNIKLNNELGPNLGNQDLSNQNLNDKGVTLTGAPGGSSFFSIGNQGQLSLEGNARTLGNWMQPHIPEEDFSIQYMRSKYIFN